MSSYQNPPFRCLHLKETGSTNDDAMELASKTDPPDGFCIFTDFQTGGRGQYGRKWQSAAGKNLLASYIFKTAFLKMEDVFSLHLMASLSVYHHLNSFGLPDLKIKWPNDILVSGRKIAGILIQNSLRANTMVHTIVGIGLNLNQEKFSEDLDAVSLKMLTGRDHEPRDHAESIFGHLMQHFGKIKGGVWEEMLPEYNESLHGLDFSVRCETQDGNFFHAVIKRVDRDGKIWLQYDGRLLNYSFGELRILPAVQEQPGRPA